MDNIAIQCYSVRDRLEADPAATYRGLKDAGYNYVELFQVGPQNAGECRRMLDDAGIKAICAHVDYDTVIAHPARAIDTARILGIDAVVIPWLDLHTAEDWIDAAKTMDAVGAELRAAAVRLGYHNHDHEFSRIYDGTTAFDLIFNTASPDNLFCELDTFWAETGGGDPIAIIRNFGARCPMLHLKDRAPADAPIRFAEIGSGTTDWPPLFDAARAAGVEWYIVEQDESQRDTLESAAVSARFMKGR